MTPQRTAAKVAKKQRRWRQWCRTRNHFKQCRACAWGRGCGMVGIPKLRVISKQ